MLEFAWVGVPVTMIGLVWLVLAGPRLLAHRGERADSGGGVDDRRYVTEVVVGNGSPLAGLSRGDAERRAGVRLHGILRDGRFLFGRPEALQVAIGDVLVIEAGRDALAWLLGEGRSRLARGRGGNRHEAVVMPQSTVLGSSAGLLHAFAARDVEVVAVAPQRRRIEGRLADLQLGVGDILVLDGDPLSVREAVAATETMALSPPAQPAVAGSGRLPLAVFALAVGLAATGLVAPEIALGGGVLALALCGRLSLRQALGEINWSIVVMLAAMIPLGAAVETTGAAQVLAGWLVGVVAPAPPLALVGAILLLAVTLTPFVNNVSAAVVLAPIAIETARSAGLAPEPFLFAVALGVSLDFLTPFGHHNNTIAMGIGGYRFADFPVVGAPLLVLGMAVGLLAIQLAWLG